MKRNRVLNGSSQVVPSRLVVVGWEPVHSTDWTISVEQQIPTDIITPIDVLVASDCVWLVSMLDDILDTVAGIFQHSPNVKFLMSFQRPDSDEGDSSRMFTTVDCVLVNVMNRGWTIDCLAWQPVVYDKDDSIEVFFFEIGQNGDE